EASDMVCLQALRTLLPATARNLIRQNKIAIRNTSGMSAGYNQANVVILHRSLADDFEKFCRANSGPLPLLYRSAPGEWKCPPLSTESDIQTDCLLYRRYENGTFAGSLTSLENYSEQLKDMVTFYLGCSFSFESAVQKLGVPVIYYIFKNCTQAESPLAFTHSPGCMFITDIKNEEAPESDSGQTPAVVQISSDPLQYSLVSQRAADKIRALEKIIGVDPGDRGIKNLLVRDELLKSCLSLSHAKSILITTGFPTHFQHQPPEENDGPPGAIAMAAMLQALGKKAAIVTDERAIDLNRSIIEKAVEQGVLKTPVPLLSYKEDAHDAALKFLCESGDPASPRFDHLVAIERAGRASDGNYYNARKINIKHLVDPIDDLFEAAQNIRGISTTGMYADISECSCADPPVTSLQSPGVNIYLPGIGDGGNELGTGKVKELVKKHIPNGDTIACDVAADFAVIAGVSNWGGYAVSCALYLLNTCEIHERYLRRAVGFPRLSERESWASSLPSVSKEEKLLEILIQHGVRSGKTASLAMEVDGLPFFNTHSDMIRSLLDVTL
ncbi:hypothetical protein AB205_0041760, partial [Aquarana catesbeiana]